MSGTWTAAYARYGEHRDEEFDILRQAVAFASRGVETWDYSVIAITAPDGEVIEGDDLDEATLHFDLGDEDYDRVRVAKWRPRLAETPNAVTCGKSGSLTGWASARDRGRCAVNDLEEFLRARLDDDEAYARNAFADHNDAGRDWHEPSSGLLDVGDGDVIITNDSQVSRFMERFDPARILVEVESRRRLMEGHSGPDIGFCQCNADCPCPTLRLLALPYASHPAYRDE